MEEKKIYFDKKDIYIYVLFLIAMSFTFRNLYEYYNFDFWRNDALYYLGSYYQKLETEGRWINYFLFDILKRVPAIISIIIHYVGLGYFIYKSTENITQDWKLSLMIALVVVNNSPLQAQLTWPVVTLAGFVYIGIIPFIYNKMSKNIFFLLSGVIFFGTLSNYYFIIPIIFLGEILDSSKDKKVMDSLVYVIKKYIIPWVFFFVVGFAVSNFITYLITGHIIQPASWRESNPATNLNQFMLNLQNVMKMFWSELIILKNTIGILAVGLIVLIRAYSTKKEQMSYILVCIMITLSVHLSTVFNGIGVAHRTVVPMIIGLVFLFLLPKYRLLKNYTANIIVAFFIAIMFSNFSYDNIHWFRVMTNQFETEILAGDIEMNPTHYQNVIVLAEGSEVIDFTEKVTERNFGLKYPVNGFVAAPDTIRPAFIELGFNRIMFNPEGYVYEKTYDSEDMIIKKVDADNNLVVYFNIK